MSIKLGDNFKYLGKKFLDDRESFDTLSTMKECNTVPDGFVTFCKENGKRYEYLSSNKEDPKTGKWTEFKVGTNESSDSNHDCYYVGDSEPDDDNVIWFDTGNVGDGDSSEITYDNPIINELVACIRSLQEQVRKLQDDVEYLKMHGGGGSGNNPENPDKPGDGTEEVVDVVLALEDGGLFMLEDGGFMILEESVVVEKPDVPSVTESILLLEDGAQVLYENGANILLEKQ